MSVRFCVTSLLALLPLSLSPALAGEVVDRYRIISAGRPAGTALVTTRGEEVEVDFRIDDNGRGAKLRERLHLGPDGLPIEWRIAGTSDAGAPVAESYVRTGDTARWKSLNDQGQEEVSGPAVYVANDASPWALGAWARAALRTDGGRIRALPAGEVHVERLREVRLEGATSATATAVRLSGYALSPDYLLLEGDGRLLAYLADGWVVADERIADQYGALTALARQLDGEALSKLAQATAHRSAGPIHLRNVRVFDSVKARLGEPTTVVVFRDKIVGVRPDAVPEAGAQIVEGEGGVLLPGLCDVHAHLRSWDGPLHLAAGVTSVRDPGNDNDTLLALTTEIDAGRLLGPRVVRAGFLEGSSPFSASFGFTVGRLDEALEKVRWYADRGYWQIKIYNSMNPEWVKPIAAEAHRLGLRVAGHVPAFMTSERAVRDGYDEITHINQLLLSFVIGEKEDTRTPFRFTALGERVGKLDLHAGPFQRMLRLMKERRTAHDPTLGAFEGLLLSRPGRTLPTDASWLDHMPSAVQRSRRAAALDVKPDQYPAYDASWKKLLETIRLLDASGIRLLPGTDYGVPGFSLHSELDLWTQAGIPTARVLQHATWNCARYFGHEQQLGSIEPGKLADLLLVAGDPLQSIGDLRKVRLVMKGGVVYYPEEIHAALGVKLFASKAILRAAGRSP